MRTSSVRGVRNDTHPVSPDALSMDPAGPMRDWWIAAARIALVAPIPPARPDAAALLAVSLDEIRSVSTACVTACCVTLDARSMRRPKWTPCARDSEDATSRLPKQRPR